MRPLRFAALMALALGLLAGCGIIDDIIGRINDDDDTTEPAVRMPVRAPENSKYYEDVHNLMFVPGTHDVIVRYRFYPVRWTVEERAGESLHVVRGDSLEWDLETAFSGSGTAVSPDGALLVNALPNFPVTIRRTEDGKVVRVIDHGDRSFTSPEFSPDGRFLVTGNVPLIDVWRVADGDLVGSWSAHQNVMWDIAFARDGTWLATASHDESLRLWSFPDGRLIRTLGQNSEVFYRVAVTPDGREVISGGSSVGLRIWDAATGSPLQTLAPGPVYEMAMSSDGTRFVTVGHRQDGLRQVRIWDLPARRMIAMIDSISAGVPAISDDDRYVAIGFGAGKNHFRLLRLSEGVEVDRVYLEGPWPPPIF